MKALQLPNDGYIRSSLPKDLFDTLLIEGLKCYNKLSNPGNATRITGLARPDGTQTCPHYDMSDKNSDYLKQFMFPYVDRYMENFPYIQNMKCLTSNSPFIFKKPWYNIQRPNDYLPIHTHDGVLSYTIWLKLPPLSEFIFYYSGIVHQMDYTMRLTPQDEGDFIFFPATLNHGVHPFPSNNPNEIRISISGNISLQGVDDYLSK